MVRMSNGGGDDGLRGRSGILMVYDDDGDVGGRCC